MSAGLLVQWLIVSGLLAWSLWRILRVFMPAATGQAGGCGSGCNTCGSCSANPKPEQPVQWRSPS